MNITNIIRCIRIDSLIRIMLFAYKVRTKKGKVLDGLVDANTLDEARHLLKGDDLDILDVSPYKKPLLDKLLSFGQKVKIKEKVVFTRQLAVMVSANLPLVRALRILTKQTENKAFKKIIQEVAEELEGGIRFSMALGKHPDVFNTFFVNMVRSGETTGELADTLVYLADQMEKDYDLVSRIKGAMIYPIFIFIGMIVVGIIMMIFIIPRMTEQLTEFGGQLPLSTRMLIGLSSFMASNWILLLGVLLGVIIGVRFYTRTDRGRIQFDYLLLKTPIFGSLFQRIYLVRITRSLQTLTAGKVPLPEGLKVVSKVVGNAVYKEMIEQTIKEVEDGNSLSSVFVKSSVMPIMLSQMIVVGEQTGQLTEVLMKVTDFYTREIDNLVANLVNLIEPVIMIIMGLAVGFMVAAIIMPTFNLASQL